MTPMNAKLRSIAPIFMAALLVGCGGSGGPGGGPVGGPGELTFTVEWPDRTRMIPNAANAIRVRIFPEGVSVNNPGNAVGSLLIARPGGLPSAVTANLQNVAAGAYEVVAEGFAGIDDGGTPADPSDDSPIGNALSRGQGQAVIVAGETTPFTVTMNPELARMRVTIRSASQNSPATNLPNTGVITNVSGTYRPDELYFIEAAPQNAAGSALLLPTAEDLEITFGGTGGMQVLAQQAETSGTTPVARAVFAPSGFGTAGFQINYFDGGGAGTGRIQMTFRGRIAIQSLNAGNATVLTPAGSITNLIDVGVDDFGVANGWILARGASGNPGVVTGINNAGNALSAPASIPSVGDFGVVANGRIAGDYVLSGSKIGRVSAASDIDFANGRDVAQLDGSPGAAGPAFFLSGAGGNRSVARGTGDLSNLVATSIGSGLNGFDNLAAGVFFSTTLNPSTAAEVVYVADSDEVRQFRAGTSTQPTMINELGGNTQTFAQASDSALTNGSVTDIASLGGLLFVLNAPAERVLVFNVRGAKITEYSLPATAGGVSYTRFDVGFGSTRAIVALRSDNTAVRIPLTLN